MCYESKMRVIRNFIDGLILRVYRPIISNLFYVSSLSMFCESFKSEKKIVEMSDFIKEEKYMHRIQDLIRY